MNFTRRCYTCRKITRGAGTGCLGALFPESGEGRALLAMNLPVTTATPTGDYSLQASKDLMERRFGLHAPSPTKVHKHRRAVHCAAPMAVAWSRDGRGERVLSWSVGASRPAQLSSDQVVEISPIADANSNPGYFPHAKIYTCK